VSGANDGVGGYTLLVTEQPVYADIQAKSVTMPSLDPNSDPRGQNPLPVTPSYTLQNNGPFSMDNGETYDYEVDIYLSKSGSSAGTGSQIGSETIHLPGENTGSLTAAAYTIPSDLAAGNYYVWLHVTPLSGSPTDSKSADDWVVSVTNNIYLPPPSTLTIAGIVTKSGGQAGLSGALVTLVSSDESITNTAVTDSYGRYSLTMTNVATNGWSGTITPSTTNGAAGGFAPAVRAYTNVIANLVAQDFAWIPPPVISGKVTKGGTSTGIASVMLVLSNGSLTVSTNTDAKGNYSITLPSGWTGTVTTVTPSTNGLTGAFAPTYLSYTNIGANQTAQNFTYGALPVISGKVTQSGSTNGVGGVTITFSNNVSTITITTDGNGSYSNTVPYKWSGKATASFTSGGFATPTITYGALTANQTGKNYIWTPSPVISGKVTKSGSTNGVRGVTIAFSNNVSTMTITTDGNGSYSNTVPYKWSGKATASFTSGGFATPTITYGALTASQTGKNYIWTSSPMISGKVTKSGAGTAVTNIVITFVGNGTTNTTTTDANGYYSNVVVYGWTGTVTPSNVAGCGFSPVSKSYSKLTANSAGQNFTWLPPPIISGKVTQSGTSTGVTGVTITASNGGGTTNTGVGGTYSLTVPYNWTGVVTCASASGGTFSPTSKSFKTKVTANQTLNFTWTAPKQPSAAPKPSSVTSSVSVTTTNVPPRQLLHTTGMVRWTGADAALVRHSPELLTVALADGAVKVEPVVPVIASGDMSTAIEFVDGLPGMVGVVAGDLVVIRNAQGLAVAEVALPDTIVVDTVLFLTPGDDAILTWDILLLRP
jgi:hypothetical protein